MMAKCVWFRGVGVLGRARWDFICGAGGARLVEGVAVRIGEVAARGGNGIVGRLDFDALSHAWGCVIWRFGGGLGGKLPFG